MRHTTEVIQDDDLLEMEQHDSVSEGAFATAASELDDLLVLSNTVEYKECAPTVPSGRDLLDLSASEIAQIALVAVQAEGPIHT